jgi:hypothetical protein
MLEAETIISAGVILVSSEPDKRFATITCPALAPSQPVEDTMLEADQSYLPENSPTMTRRALFAAPLAMILPEPIPPPMPITCLPCPVRGRPFEYR